MSLDSRGSETLEAIISAIAYCAPNEVVTWGSLDEVLKTAKRTQAFNEYSDYMGEDM